MLSEAVRAVPAVKYAVGVGGIVAVVAIVAGFGIQPLFAVLGSVVTLVLMVALLVFARLTRTGPKYFLVPALVLMWSFLGLSIATACLLFTIVFFSWPIPINHLVSPSTQTNQPGPGKSLDKLLKSAELQSEGGDYEGAWKDLQQLASIQPASSALENAQMDVSMAWLRNIVVTEQHKFGEIVNQLLPCLYAGAAQTNGRRAADLFAHIGWGNMLKSRDGEIGLRVEENFKQALSIEPQNVYANAMWASWKSFRDGSPNEVEQAFERALKTGRDKPFVRTLQLAALGARRGLEDRLKLIKVCNEMRVNGEDLPARERDHVMENAYYLNEWLEEDPGLGKLMKALPPADNLATFLWVTQGQDFTSSGSLRFFLARFQETAGEYAKSLRAYISLQVDGFTEEKVVKQGIARCEKELGGVKTALQFLLEWAKGDDPSARELAMKGLPKLAPEPLAVLPTLTAGLRDENRDVRNAAGQALAETGTPAVPALIQALDDKDPTTVRLAAQALGEIGPEAKDAVPGLTRALGSKDVEVRLNVVRALAKMGAEAASAVPELIKCVEGSNEGDLPEVAAYALGEIGPGARAAEPALIRLLKNKKGDAQGHRGANAATALGAIGASSSEAIAALSDGVREDFNNDGRPSVPLPCAEALGRLGAPAKTAIPVLVEDMRRIEDQYKADRAAFIGQIAQALMTANDTNSVHLLENALREMESEKLELKVTAPVREALQALKR